MRKLFVLGVVLAGLILGGCAPTVGTVQPLETEELVSPLPFTEAFSAAITAVNSQPYPSDSGGWVITDSDQVGGFISAELNGVRSSFWTGPVPYRAFVSVALVSRSDSRTQVNLSTNSHEEAAKLARSIRARLQLQ
jgi:hypothetical protein